MKNRIFKRIWKKRKKEEKLNYFFLNTVANIAPTVTNISIKTGKPVFLLLNLVIGFLGGCLGFLAATVLLVVVFLDSFKNFVDLKFFDEN